VVLAIEGDTADPHAHGCNRRLRYVDGAWQIQPI
jgi:hypothetical protein